MLKNCRSKAGKLETVGVHLPKIWCGGPVMFMRRPRPFSASDNLGFAQIFSAYTVKNAVKYLGLPSYFVASLSGVFENICRIVVSFPVAPRRPLMYAKLRSVKRRMIASTWSNV